MWCGVFSPLSARLTRYTNRAFREKSQINAQPAAGATHTKAQKAPSFYSDRVSSNITTLATHHDYPGYALSTKETRPNSAMSGREVDNHVTDHGGVTLPPLPGDILYDILSYLSHKDKANLRLANRETNNMVDYYEWHTFKINFLDFSKECEATQNENQKHSESYEHIIKTYAHLMAIIKNIPRHCKRRFRNSGGSVPGAAHRGGPAGSLRRWLVDRAPGLFAHVGTACRASCPPWPVRWGALAHSGTMH